ncbi:nucleic acid-binding, OB-fold protein [Tanacetum coccineum]
MSAATIASLRIGQENCILEAKVYQRWISKSVPDMKALAYCCILIDKEPYQQTLENQITLRFGKIIVFPLSGKESEFPDHHFELISYHQLPSRVPYKDENSKLIYLILTDYLGCVRSISDITPFGTPTISQKYLRKVDIEDLEFKEKYNSNQPLQIAKYRCQDLKEEKIRNRQTLHTLLEQNLTIFKGVHFTCEGMITSVQENRDWKYPSCSECSKSSTQQNGKYVCEDHGKQDPVTYRYKFKAAVTDGTTTAQFTFFTKAAAFIADDVLDIQPSILIEDAGSNDS